ncbi:interferon gamma [Echeneis naucrates]|uniref:Interferon gamma-like n=1 Tax=Echeneis naucrates TaxID=173247 RepID=A0A665UAY3_ECHNA|nr:interferon gamma-like [Echeneis naucrates]
MMVATTRTVVYLALWLCVCQVRGFHIPAKMNKTIHNLLQHYNISSKQMFNGKPVFPKDLLSSKMETKRLFLGGVFEVYEKLFERMLQELPTPGPETATAGGAGPETGNNVRSQLTYILEKVQELRKHNYQQQNKLLQRLHELKHIQMDNLVVQSKALYELPMLYSQASSLSGDMMRRRRRRQARRIKPAQRG